MTPTVTCPFCEEELPVRITLEGALVGDYITIDGFTWGEAILPEITVSIHVDLDGIARDLEKILAKKKEMEKLWGELKGGK